MMPIEFSIRYSMQERDQQEALALARRLFAVYDTGIDSLSLVPTEKPGVAIYFNGRPVTSFNREDITVVRRPDSEAGTDGDITCAIGGRTRHW